MRKTAVKVLAPMLAFSLVAAACGGDDTADAPADEPAAEEPAAEEPAAEEPAAEEPAAEEPAAEEPAAEELTEISVTGPERSDEEAGALQQVLGAWGEANGVTVTYTGDADWEANINVQVEAGNPPDISIFPQPGKLADFARDGYIVPLSAETDAAIEWSDSWKGFGNVDGVQYGVPVKSDLKSLVWYSPARFAADGYEVPTTFDEFVALVDEITAAGGSKALCVGIESGQATGWAFTDWVEEMVLRQAGTDVYDQWVAGEVTFSDEPIQTAMQTVIDLWTEDNVYASAGTIAATAFQDNAIPLVEGDCYMHRQANFYASFIPEDTAFGDGEGEIDVFYFPDINGDSPVLVAGTLAAAFNDNPKVMELLAYMGSAEYATARQTAQAELKGGNGTLSGFLSAAIGQDPAIYNTIEQSFLSILDSAAIARFDGSDLMPSEVGAGSFWTEGTSLVNGDIDVATAGANIDATWPS